jgi:hypothetical protein
MQNLYKEAAGCLAIAHFSCSPLGHMFWRVGVPFLGIQRHQQRKEAKKSIAAKDSAWAPGGIVSRPWIPPSFPSQPLTAHSSLGLSLTC